MKQIKTAGKDIICAEVPEDTTWWEIIDNDLGKLLTKTLDLPQQFLQYGKKSTIFGKEVNNQVYYNPNNFYLPKGKHKILGKLSELSEEECSRFVKESTKREYGCQGFSGCYINYYDYASDVYRKDTAKESLISLLQSNGIDTSKENELLIIEIL